MVPRSFGECGPYRGDEVAQVTALPIAYARHQTFEECHLDVFEAKRKGKHAGVACEACHGPQAKGGPGCGPATLGLTDDRKRLAQTGPPNARFLAPLSNGLSLSQRV